MTLKLRTLCVAQSLAVALLLSQVVLAQNLVPSAPSGQVGGTISSVAGTTVKILNDLVAIDAGNARIVGKGGPLTITALRVGTRIFATLGAGNPAGGAGLPATTIVVEELPAGTLTSTIDLLDVAGSKLVVEGLTVKVTNATIFGGLSGGSRVDDLSDLRVNELVAIELLTDGSTLVATRIQLLAPVPLPTVRLTGTVKTITQTTWTITTPEGRDTPVTVTSATRIVGSPKTGDRVEVLGSLDATGAIVATTIVKTTIPEPPQTTSFEGTVRAINGPVWTVDSTRVLVSPLTVVTGSPKAGDRVRVTGYRAPGSFLATAITKL